MDGKSLVGVTQSYAATVLRSTSGRVHFLIGREQDPENSEIAQLITQSIKSEQIQQKMMNDFDNNMEQFDKDDPNSIFDEHVADDDFEPLSYQINPNVNQMQSQVYIQNNNHTEDECSYHKQNYNQQQSQVSEKSTFNGNYTQQQHIQSLRDIDLLKRNIIEWQTKCTSLTDEIIRIKHKSDAKIRDLQKQLEDELVNSKEKEAEIINLQKELEQKNNDFKQKMIILEKKYLKAKKLVKDFQQKEHEMTQKEVVQQQIIDEEKQESSALIRALKDKIIHLERKLLEAQRKGILNSLQSSSDPLTFSLSDSNDTENKPKLNKQDTLEDIVCEENKLDEEDFGDSTCQENTLQYFIEVADQVQRKSLLDVSFSKQKAELVSRGSLAHRQPPTLLLNRKNCANSDESSNDDEDISNQVTPTTEESSMKPAIANSSPVRTTAKVLSQAAAVAYFAKVNSPSHSKQVEKPVIPDRSTKPIISPTNESLRSNLNLPVSTLDSNCSSQSTSYGFNMDSPIQNSRFSSSTVSPVKTSAESHLTALSSSSSGSLNSPLDYEELFPTNGCEISKTNVSQQTSSLESNDYSTYQNCSLSSQTLNGFTISDWSVLDVVEFLRQNHLTNYAKRFQDENITGARFIQLDSAQLKVCVCFYNVFPVYGVD